MYTPVQTIWSVFPFLPLFSFKVLDVDLILSWCASKAATSSNFTQWRQFPRRLHLEILMLLRLNTAARGAPPTSSLKRLFWNYSEWNLEYLRMRLKQERSMKRDQLVSLIAVRWSWLSCVEDRKKRDGFVLQNGIFRGKQTSYFDEWQPRCTEIIWGNISTGCATMNCITEHQCHVSSRWLISPWIASDWRSLPE